MCSKGSAKCLLIIFNTIFFLLGAGCLILGIFVLVDKSAMLSALSKIPSAQETVEDVIDKTSILQGSAIALIVAGSVIFVIGFCGCCGAIKESKCMLFIYALFIFIILAAQIAAAVLAFFFKDTVDENLQTYLEDTIKKYYTGATFQANGKLGESIEPISAAWDFAMAYFECCGNKNYLDFNNYAQKWNKTYTVNSKKITAKVPVTCCKMEDPSKFPSDLDNVKFVNVETCLESAASDSTNQDPCYTKIEEFLKQYSLYVYVVALVIAGLELLLIIATCCLIKAIGKDD